MLSVLYNVYKVSEGGLGQAMAYEIARDAGAEKNQIQRMPSIYVGQTAIRVTASSAVHRKISKALYR